MYDMVSFPIEYYSLSPCVFFVFFLLLEQENNNNFEEILDNIFDFAKEVDEFEIADNTVITDETKVTVIESKDEPKSSIQPNFVCIKIL